MFFSVDNRCDDLCVPAPRCRAGPSKVLPAGAPLAAPGTVEKATLFPPRRRSQKSRQIGRFTDKCLVLDIFVEQLAVDAMITRRMFC
jgi:hypothetical protein